jgi:hypothetical protein
MAVPLLIAATAMSAIGAISSAQAQKSAANYNAQLAERNAVISDQQTRAALMAQRRESSKRMGDMRAAFSASGVTWEGSALDVLEDSVAQSELERQNISYQGKLRRMGFESDAALDRASGKNAMRAGYFSATSTILSGANSGFGMSSGGVGSPGYVRPGGNAPIVERSS